MILWFTAQRTRKICIFLFHLDWTWESNQQKTEIRWSENMYLTLRISSKWDWNLMLPLKEISKKSWSLKHMSANLFVLILSRETSKKKTKRESKLRADTSLEKMLQEKMIQLRKETQMCFQLWVQLQKQLIKACSHQMIWIDLQRNLPD